MGTAILANYFQNQNDFEKMTLSNFDTRIRLLNHQGDIRY